MSAPSSDEMISKIIKATERSSWWKEVVEELMRVERVNRLPEFITDEHKAIVMQAVWEGCLITEDDLTQASEHPVFQEAQAIISQLKQDDPFPERLTELYVTRKSYALDRIDQCFRELLPLITNEACREEVRRRWSSAETLPSFLSLISRYPTNDPNQRYLLRSIIELSELRPSVSDTDYPFEFEKKYTPMKLGEAGQETDRVRFLAYRVYEPLWFDGMEQFEPRYIDFPLKWAGSIFDVTTMRGVYTAFKGGRDVMGALSAYFREDNQLDRLEDAIKNCPLTRKHGELFAEIANSFRSGSFKICSRSLLSLLEGILWDFAWWWNEKFHAIFSPGTTAANYLRGEFKLLNRSGQAINTRPTIGLLLRNTKFGDEFYFEFLEYYCQELFLERNPVLHGRDPEYGDEEKAASLLLATRIVEKKITEVFTQALRKSVQEETAA